MKKTLVALAALAATAAFAQSTVTIKGTVDAAYVNTQTTTSGVQTSATAMQHNKQGTSQVTFLGEEDLGGGLKALFLYEGDFDATKGAKHAAANADDHVLGSGGGEVYVGLSGAFGSIKLGSPNTPSLTAQGARTPFGTKTGGGFGTTSGTSHVRTDSSMVYASPSFSGFNAAVGVTTQTTTTDAAVDIGLNYANGPLSVNYSNYQDNYNATQNNLAVSYAFGPAKVTVGYMNQDNQTITAAQTTSKSSGYNIAVAYAVTPTINVLANYGKLNDDLGTNAAAPKDRKIGTLGLQYVMSKRTSVYARYVNESNDNVATTNIKTTLVGLQHNF